MLRGSPVTGARTTSGAVFFGSAASGARCRRAGNGCPAIGARPGQAPPKPHEAPKPDPRVEPTRESKDKGKNRRKDK